jgi:hypothetical protein
MLNINSSSAPYCVGAGVGAGVWQRPLPQETLGLRHVIAVIIDARTGASDSFRDVGPSLD